MKKKSFEVDMINGALLPRIISFTLPLIASGILQLLFNAADMVVAGRYAGSIALGAVGATGSLVNLFINVFLGLSVGTNVTVAHYFGASRDKELRETVHTSILLSVICGLFLVAFGNAFCAPMLRLMGTPEEILPHSVIYLRIYFAGMPVVLLYNFGSAILRAVGDTRRPLYFLLLAGVINVGLNLLFVINFGMGVAGVALATIISQAISATLVVICLIKTDMPYGIRIRELKLSADKVKRIMRIGLPAGFQGAIFSFSNVLIQSSVNSFGAVAVAGNTAAMNLEGFVYNAMNAFHQTAISFTGQNMGARKPERIIRITLICEICVVVTGLIMGIPGYLCGGTLLSIYTSDAEVISFGIRRLAVIFTTYFLCGMMDVMVGVIRGMGYSIMPMIVSLMGACVFRIVWIFTIFKINHTLTNLYISYPASWLLTFLVHFVCFMIVQRSKINRTKNAE